MSTEIVDSRKATGNLFTVCHGASERFRVGEHVLSSRGQHREERG